MIWTILGISVAIMAVFCISMAETVVGNSFFETYRHYIAATIGIFGIGCLIAGRIVAAGDDKSEGASKRFVLFDLRYWGPMLVALGIITVFIRPLRFTKEVQKVVVAAAPKKQPPPVVKAEPPPPPKAEPAKFPKLKMQGVIFSEDRPVAIINGHSYTVGDRLGEVQVKSIDRGSVKLELEGQFLTLTMK